MKVLIVDDEAGVRTYLETVATQAGHTVATAADGSLGVEKLASFSPDLVFSDIRMPNMDGLTFLRHIHETAPSTIAVIITAFGTEETAAEALRLGASNYLRKPVKVEEIQGLLEKYCNVIEERQLEQVLEGLVVERTLKLEVDNSLALRANLANFLVRSAEHAIDEKLRMKVALGLGELLTNAAEHGNLEITYDEKETALGEPKGLSRLYGERMDRQELAERKVTVQFAVDRNGACQWIIADQGPGFNWQAVPNPLDPACLRRRCGRGIFLAKTIFGEIDYLGKGNVVRVRLDPS